MGKASRYSVRPPDCWVIAGCQNLDTVEFVALDYGVSAHLVDTEAPVCHPMVQEVEDAELAYLSYGGWGVGRYSLDQDLIEGIKKGHVAIAHESQEQTPSGRGFASSSDRTRRSFFAG